MFSHWFEGEAFPYSALQLHRDILKTMMEDLNKEPTHGDIMVEAGNLTLFGSVPKIIEHLIEAKAPEWLIKETNYRAYLLTPPPAA